MSDSVVKKNETMKRLNLGCGAHVPAGWMNVDYALGARLAKIPFFRTLNRRLHLLHLDWSQDIYLHDLRQPFPWEADTIDVVYTSHTLEHFSREEGACFLSQCHRVLRVGGIIRVVVPDLARLVQQYTDKTLRADEFVDHLGISARRHAGPLRRTLSPWMELSLHKCMYDTPTLLDILRGLGFGVGARAPFESDIDDIDQVEIEGRAQDAVIVEGKKL